MAAVSRSALRVLRKAPGFDAAALFRLALCCLLLALGVPAPAQSGHRLMLKDGSWQEVITYEVRGDRTRYLSTLRYEWEEVPTDLVDWPATKHWNAQKHPKAGEGAAIADDVLEGLDVAPGLALPTRGGVFLLDRFSGGPSLVELIQTPGTLNRSAGIFHSSAGPRAPVKQQLKIRGASARTHAHVPLPQIFVKLSEPQGGGPGPEERFRIVRLERDKDSRILASINSTITGKHAETHESVPAHTERFHDEWLRVVPAQELHPGEYALVEMLDRDRINSHVWDFSYDPNASGNVNVRMPYSEATVDQRHTDSPELKPRQK